MSRSYRIRRGGSALAASCRRGRPRWRARAGARRARFVKRRAWWNNLCRDVPICDTQSRNPIQSCSIQKSQPKSALKPALLGKPTQPKRALHRTKPPLHHHQNPSNPPLFQSTSSHKNLTLPSRFNTRSTMYSVSTRKKRNAKPSDAGRKRSVYLVRLSR